MTAEELKNGGKGCLWIAGWLIVYILSGWVLVDMARYFWKEYK